MDREMESFEKAGTGPDWTTVSRPPDETFVGSKWVFRTMQMAL